MDSSKLPTFLVTLHRQSPSKNIDLHAFVLNSLCKVFKALKSRNRFFNGVQVMKQLNTFLLTIATVLLISQSTAIAGSWFQDSRGRWYYGSTPEWWAYNDEFEANNPKPANNPEREQWYRDKQKYTNDKVLADAEASKPEGVEWTGHLTATEYGDVYKPYDPTPRPCNGLVLGHGDPCGNFGQNGSTTADSGSHNESQEQHQDQQEDNTNTDLSSNDTQPNLESDDVLQCNEQEKENLKSNYTFATKLQERVFKFKLSEHDCNFQETANSNESTSEKVASDDDGTRLVDLNGEISSGTVSEQTASAKSSCQQNIIPKLLKEHQDQLRVMTALYKNDLESINCSDEVLAKN